MKLVKLALPAMGASNCGGDRGAIDRLVHASMRPTIHNVSIREKHTGKGKNSNVT